MVKHIHVPIPNQRSESATSHVIKEGAVRTALTDFLFDVAMEMETEDGVIWVLSLDDDSVIAFTDFGVDSLVELIKIHREMTPREER